MDLAALRIFKVDAQEGSVTHAAARLHCEQSNVSARLMQLEEKLGKPLFQLEFDTFEAIVACVPAGMGVALMPQAIVRQRNLGRTIQCHSLPPRIARVKTLLVWRKDVPKHGARQAFAEVMTVCCSNEKQISKPHDLYQRGLEE